MEVNTVCIPVEDYTDMVLEIHDKRGENAELKRGYRKIIEAIELYARKDTNYGKYSYVSENLKTLLNVVGIDSDAFDFTKGKPEE